MLNKSILTNQLIKELLFNNYNILNITKIERLEHGRACVCWLSDNVIENKIKEYLNYIELAKTKNDDYTETIIWDLLFNIDNHIN